MTTILFLHNKTGISGGEQSLLNLWRNLDRARFSPVLVLPGKGDFADEAHKNGVTVEFCPVPKLVPLNIAAIIRACRSLNALCKKHSVHLIHSYTPRNNLVAWAIGRIVHIPVIWHERNMTYGKERDVTKLLLSLPDCVICNSNAVASRFIKHGAVPSKVKTVINGVDVKTFRPAPPLPAIAVQWNPLHEKTIGIISNLSKRKGVDMFIDVAALVFKKHPRTRFLIIGGEFGDNEQGRRAELDGLIAKAGLCDRLAITGFVSNVHEIIPLFDIGVAVTEKEACSRAILEMMACGKPVVAFDTGGNSELIDHTITGLMYPYGDTESLAGGIVRLLDDPDTCARMGAAARTRIESHFDVVVNAGKTMDIYDHLLMKGGCA